MHESVEQQSGKGRVLAAAVYVLYIGSVMAVVTAPLGMIMAWAGMGRAEAVAHTHLHFQVRTFWIGIIAALGAFSAWHLLGMLGAPAWASWSLGYGFFTLALVWMLARCAVGIRRLMSGRAVDDPYSLLFGGARIAPVAEVRV